MITLKSYGPYVHVHSGINQPKIFVPQERSCVVETVEDIAASPSTLASYVYALVVNASYTL